MAPKVKHMAQKRMGSSSTLPKRQKPSFGMNFWTFVVQTRFDETFTHCEVIARRVIKFDLSINFPYLSTFEDFGWANYLKMNAFV